MAPSSFQWWGKESYRGTPVVVKMENPNWSMLELESPFEEDFLVNGGSSNSHGNGHGGVREKGRGKNAKQLTWVLLLKAQRAAGYLTSMGSALFGLGAAIRRRVASGRTDSENNEKMMSCLSLIWLLNPWRR
ncbi:putative xyloglucan glycosyltransferase 12 [Ranunculus cassubicifolius]